MRDIRHVMFSFRSQFIATHFRQMSSISKAIHVPFSAQNESTSQQVTLTYCIPVCFTCSYYRPIYSLTDLCILAHANFLTPEFIVVSAT